MKRRILSIITALALCLSLCPAWALAAEGEPETPACICEELCTEDSVNESCPVCGMDGADLADCNGKQPAPDQENGLSVISYDESVYSKNDVDVINAIIDNNNLSATRDDPASWEFATWDDSSPKRITQLILRGESLTGTLDVSGLSRLTYLYCVGNQLVTLNVSGLSSLTALFCGDNQLGTLDVSGLSSLTRLDCSKNQLETLNVSGLSRLTYLNCSNNRLGTLDVSGLSSLTELSCSTNKLVTLDVSGLSRLTKLSCSDNQLVTLDVSGLSRLTYLYCYNNKLGTLDVSKNTALIWLLCNNNQLGTLDVTGLSRLTTLSLGDNPLTSFTSKEGESLTITPLVSGTVKMTSVDLTDGTTINLTVTLDPGYIVEWTGLPEGTDTSANPVTFILNSDVTVKVKKLLTDDMIAAIPAQTYTGSAIQPALTVTDGSPTIIQESDYTVSYTNNNNVGTATATITATADGNYSGSASKTFEIVKADSVVGEPTISPVTYGQDFTVTFTPKLLTQKSFFARTFSRSTTPAKTAELYLGDTLLATQNNVTENTEVTFTVNADKRIPSSAFDGTAQTFTIRWGGDDNLNASEGSVTATLNKKTLTGEVVSSTSKVYDGTNSFTGVALTLTGVVSGDTVTATADGTSAITDAGTHAFTATQTTLGGADAGYYSLAANAVSGNVEITKKTLNNDMIAAIPAQTYTGSAIQPALTVTDGSPTIIQQSDYTVSYTNNNNVGAATATITATAGGNYSGTAQGTFTITAKPLTGAEVEVTGTFTYTGNAQEPAPTVTLDGKTLTAGTDYTVAYADNTNAGTAKITVTGTGNYSGTAQGTFTIDRADLTVDGTGTASGTYGAKLSELAVSGLTAKLGATEISGTWKLTGDAVPNVGDSGEYTATFTPTTGAGNYNALTAQVTLTIAQATAPTPQTGTLSVQNGHAREYTYDLSRLLPVLASGQSFGGEVTYTLKTVNITEAGYYDSGTAAISGTTLTLPIKAVTSSDEGQIGTITVTISSKNFADVDATINVNRVNKQPVSIEGVTAQNGTYNGGTHNGYTGTPTASPYSGGFTTTYATADGTALSGPPTNAGDYTVTFSLDPNDTYTGSRTLSFTVAKASITITADDKQADVGTTKPALTYTVTGLVSGDTLATEPTLTCDADMNTIGQYPITASGAAVPATGNYNEAITYVPGTLRVTDPTIPVTGVTLNKTSTTLTVGGSERLTATVAPSDATDKSVTWASSNTAVATVDSSGNVTAIGAGTATITVTTADGAKTATCAVTVRTNSGGGGGGGGGGGTTTSTTVTVPVSGEKNTVHVSASVSGTTATVSKIDTTQIDHVVGENGQASMVEIDFTGLGKTIDTVKLPAAAIKDIAAKAQNEEVRGLTVKLPEAEISFDANALSAIQAQAGSQITLTVTPAKPADLNNRQKEAVGSAPVFDLTLRSSSGAITDFRGGYATVSLPYTLAAGQNPSGVVVYYLDDSGNITPCTTMYDVSRKSVIFTTGHFSLYFVGYDPAAVWVNPYSDVAEGAWYYDAVRYASENGLMGGYGNGRFGPDDTLTRAQFAQILYNKEGRPNLTGGGIFTDVAPGAWCAPAITWAAERGIVGGYGNGAFGPNDNITREQLAVMLWRYAGSPAATNKELHFNDTDEISGYALEALRWAVENGVMSGKGGGILDPKGQATRAQVAQMLKNYLER